jgi:hypothetical protein
VKERATQPPEFAVATPTGMIWIAAQIALLHLLATDTVLATPKMDLASVRSSTTMQTVAHIVIQASTAVPVEIATRKEAATAS